MELPNDPRGPTRAGYYLLSQERDLLSRVLRRLFDVHRGIYKVFPSHDLLKRGLIRYRAEAVLLQAVYATGNVIIATVSMLAAVSDAFAAVRVDPKWPTQSYCSAGIRFIDSTLVAINFAQQSPLSIACQQHAIRDISEAFVALSRGLGLIGDALLSLRAAIADLQDRRTFRSGIAAANHGLNGLQGGFAHLDRALLDIERMLFYSTSEARRLDIFFRPITPANAALYLSREFI
ncbi:hypothetical protein TRVA0_050S00848 [Trichomonascus vanleenenianus]|uniref:uncharacterized protein n=1 Tax=Trichomonascus vanleenenianus TaxID=2268995 RepID=UPI003ECBA1D4